MINKKSKAMSVQSIIIGSVIAGVIATSGLAMLWPRVEKAKISTAKSTISEIENAIHDSKARLESGEIHGSSYFMSLVDSRIQSMPNDYKIRLIFDKTDPTNGERLFIAIIPNSDFNNSSSRIKRIANGIELKFDKEEDKSRGLVTYDTTCKNGDSSDCFIIIQTKQGRMGGVDSHGISGEESYQTQIGDLKYGTFSVGGVTHGYGSLN